MQNQENAKDQVELKEQENHIIEERLAKLDKLRQAGPAYPNDFEKKEELGDIRAKYENTSAEELEAKIGRAHV